jgi:hypothetical protein
MSMTEHPLQMQREEHDHTLYAKRVNIVGTSGNQVDVTGDGKLEVNASVSATIDAVVDKWNVNDIEEASTTITYIGQEEKDGDWYLKKIDTSSAAIFSHATATNNPSVLTYSNAWTSRASITYGDYSTAF